MKRKMRSSNERIVPQTPRRWPPRSPARRRSRSRAPCDARGPAVATVGENDPPFDPFAQTKGYFRDRHFGGSRRRPCHTRRVSERIVITGAGGQVGRFLAGEVVRRRCDVLALYSAQWDITDPNAGKRIVEPGDVVINCAAYTAVDAAQSDVARAIAVDTIGARNVARVCAQVGARMIHVSTDYVFSGVFEGAPRPYEIDDPTGPLCVYGRTKLAGEQAVDDALPTAQIVRIAWVYTGVGNDFVGTMRRLAAGDGPVSVMADQIGSPTYVADLVAALLQVAACGATAPLLHAANEGAVSLFDQARAVFEGVGADAWTAASGD
jgi:dTDP-4-dehydrorhamnose reductase